MSKSKPKKKRANLRREIAKKSYLDPGSSTFLNKTKSLKKAGFSKNAAEHKQGELLANSNFTDAELVKLEPLIADLPQLCELCKKKLHQLAASDKIGAKDYAVMLKHIELLLKAAGVMKTYIEKRELVVNVTIPLSKCPKCGYEMDIMKREYEGGDTIEGKV